ncbi:hypothetical protein IW143_003920, partial [Coemansia sp. RSA 520]
MQSADPQRLQRLGFFRSTYLERLKEGDTAMLVLSALGGTGGGSGGTGGGSMVNMSGYGSGSGMNTRTRSTRGSRRNLREWSSDSENEFGQDEDVESAFETEVSSVRQGSEAGEQPKKEQDTMSGIGL